MPDVETLEQPAATESAPVIETPAAESDSLSDHERNYGLDRQREKLAADAKPVAETTEAAETRERDDTGKFAKTRHRAESQKATPEDVPRIQALTKKLRDAEREIEAFKSRPAQPAVERQPEPDAARQRSDKFPSPEEYIAIKGNEKADWNDYIDARTQWNYERLRAGERAEEASRAEAKAYQTHAEKYAADIEAATKDYPDFESVLENAPKVSKVMERASIEAGPRAAYWLATHDDERDALTNETLLDDSGNPIIPTHPAFKAAVATTRRYLSSLVAAEQRSSPPSRTAAASTGSARTSVSSPAPRPPNPVRTGSIRESDTPPGDDGSMADHERAYAPKKKRV